MAKKKGSTPQSDRSNEMSNENNEQTTQTLEIDPPQPVDQAASEQPEGAGDNAVPEGDTVIERDGQVSVENAAGELKPILGNAEEIAAEGTEAAPAITTTEIAALETTDVAALSTQAVEALQPEQAPAIQAASAPIDPPAEIDPPAAAAAPIDPPAPVEATPVAAGTPAAPVYIIGALSSSAAGATKLCVAELEDYVKEATYALTRRVTDERGAAMQSSLYRALKGAVNAPAEDFHEVMNLFLNTIHHHKDGVFHDTKVLHHMPHLNMPSAQITSFKKLVNMFISMADPHSRAATRRQINFPATLEHKDIKEDARQRVLEFFNV